MLTTCLHVSLLSIISICMLRSVQVWASGLMKAPQPLPVGPGQESVWSFPRPAIAQPTKAKLKVEFGAAVIAESSSAVRTLETSHPPSYYFPQKDVRMENLRRSDRSSFCEWKGQAIYYDVVAGDKVAPAAAWSYPQPTPTFSSIQDHIAFYPQAMDAYWVDGERVTPQPGKFYGGWVTSAVVGPFKGEPGTMYW